MNGTGVIGRRKPRITMRNGLYVVIHKTSSDVLNYNVELFALRLNYKMLNKEYDRLSEVRNKTTCPYTRRKLQNLILKTKISESYVQLSIHRIIKQLRELEN